jgi:hypothetical protein
LRLLKPSLRRIPSLTVMATKMLQYLKNQIDIILQRVPENAIESVEITANQLITNTTLSISNTS